jgi:hypothetical protein
MLDDGRQNETRAEKRGKNGGEDAVKRKFRIVAGETAKGKGKMYNLQGQLVGDNYKGVVIINGKKFLKK